MFKKTLLVFAVIAAFTVLSTDTKAQTVQEPQGTDPSWSKTYQPFKIVGNLYYVGTYDLACYLIVTSKGNILINTGLASSADQIKSSIEKLGFKLSDTKILLTTQAHFDHMGAMAKLKEMTKAAVMVDAKDADVMESGGASDYALGNAVASYQPLKPDKLLQDREVVKLGDMELTVLHHPGHTKGSSSFIFDVKDPDKSYRVLIANMPSIVTDKKFSTITDYPTIKEDYAYTLRELKNLSFDIWLSSHASQFNLHQKHKPGDAYNPSAFIDQKGYDLTLAELQKAYDKKIKE
ncbi:subclass B3 metallo-beta-lactamase [Pedobacter sp. AW1-32]|uniref:subclass B3 metallo-beta-lactamase n=1 Tax=Pedobacter sp. AW1-32 TaxID=3383026 RepID=UPI003FF0EE4A